MAVCWSNVDLYNRYYERAWSVDSCRSSAISCGVGYSIYLSIYLSRPRLLLPTPRTFILYVAFMAMLGPIGEVFICTIYHGLFGERLWFYQLAPIHHGYTSLYAPVIWGIYGGYLGLVEPLLRQWKLLKKKYALALFISFETLVLELLFNVLHRLITGEYLFFYTPPDLWHATSVQTIPFYSRPQVPRP